MYGDQLNLFKSSWAVNEGFSCLYDELIALVPFDGKIPQGRSKNKYLERFRVASNLLYDLFNNGLMNRLSHSHLYSSGLCRFYRNKKDRIILPSFLK